MVMEMIDYLGEVAGPVPLAEEKIVRAEGRCYVVVRAEF